MRLFKILFSTLVLFTVVAVLAIGALMYFVDPNQFKPVLVAEIKKQTGYTLTIDGPLAWSFYPHIAIKVAHLTLTPPKQRSVLVDAANVSMLIDIGELLRAKEALLGSVTISTLKLAKIKFENVSTDITWHDQALSFNSIQATLYQGKMMGVAAGYDLNTMPRWNWALQGKGIAIKPLLADANGNDSKIQIDGIGDVNIQAETRGVNRGQLISELNGSGSFDLRNGSVEGVDLNYLFKSADAIINKESTDMLTNTNQTAFESFNGSVSIKNGLISTDNTVLRAPAFFANTQGNLALISEQMDFHIKLVPEEDARTKWQIPVLIAGDLSHPDVRLDMLAVQKFLAGKEITKIRNKAIDEVKKHVSGEAGDILQKILGN